MSRPRVPNVPRLAASSLADLLAPVSCVICDGRVADAPLCPDCTDELLQASLRCCPRCALPVGPYADLNRGCSECRGRPLGFDAAIALGPYLGPIRDLVLRLKHQENAWIAGGLGRLLVDARRDPLTAELNLDPTLVVVPIPLHWFRKLGRGYNQAEALAESAARRLDRPLLKPLRRIKPTVKLAGIGRTERAERLKGAFQCRPDPRIQGRTVLLVDDVLTTGVTCGTAARALKTAGAARVVALVLGRAGA